MKFQELYEIVETTKSLIIAMIFQTAELFTKHLDIEAYRKGEDKLEDKMARDVATNLGLLLIKLKDRMSCFGDYEHMQAQFEDNQQATLKAVAIELARVFVESFSFQMQIPDQKINEKLVKLGEYAMDQAVRLWLKARGSDVS